jgi:hypothetical protein
VGAVEKAGAFLGVPTCLGASEIRPAGHSYSGLHPVPASAIPCFWSPEGVFYPIKKPGSTRHRALPWLVTGISPGICNICAHVLCVVVLGWGIAVGPRMRCGWREKMTWAPGGGLDGEKKKRERGKEVGTRRRCGRRKKMTEETVTADER